MVQGYCVKCKAKREMKDPKETTLKNKRRAMQGSCPICGTKMTRILPNLPKKGADEEREEREREEVIGEDEQLCNINGGRQRKSKSRSRSGSKSKCCPCMGKVHSKSCHCGCHQLRARRSKKRSSHRK